MDQTDASCPGFRDLNRLATVLKVCLAVHLTTVALSLWSGQLEIELLRRVASGLPVPPAEVVASDDRQAAMAGLYLLAFLVTAILFLRWTYLSNRNTRSLVSTGLEYTPGWAVGFYFVPFLTLWKPYQAMKEMFKASHPEFRDDWEQAPVPAILPVWWTLWIVSTFVGQALLQMALRAETPDQLLHSARIAFLSDALELPLGIVAIVVVTKLQAWQSQKYRRQEAVTA